RNAHGGARPLEVAPHVAALGRIDVERRVAPALCEEDWPKQERAPDKAHASLISKRGDAKRRRIGIGARELVPELGARHCAPLETARVCHARRRGGSDRSVDTKNRPLRGM